MKQNESIANFDRSLTGLVDCIKSLNEGLFLSQLGNWSPRDIVAHLIGWNSHIVKGCKQIQDGDLPFYDIDPGDDYCNVNAAIIERISSTDKEELLAELAVSAENLKNYMRAISPEDYTRDFGVRHKDEVITIGDTFDELIDDYDHHITQIEAWSAQR